MRRSLVCSAVALDQREAFLGIVDKVILKLVTIGAALKWTGDFPNIEDTIGPLVSQCYGMTEIYLRLKL